MTTKQRVLSLLLMLCIVAGTFALPSQAATPHRFDRTAACRRAQSNAATIEKAISSGTKTAYIYFDTVADGKYASMPLKFSPHNAEVYQIRFTLENFRVGDQEQADGTSKTVNPYVLLSYYLDGESTVYRNRPQLYLHQGGRHQSQGNRASQLCKRHLHLR